MHTLNDFHAFQYKLKPFNVVDNRSMAHNSIAFFHFRFFIFLNFLSTSVEPSFKHNTCVSYVNVYNRFILSTKPFERNAHTTFPIRLKIKWKKEKKFLFLFSLSVFSVFSFSFVGRPFSFLFFISHLLIHFSLANICDLLLFSWFSSYTFFAYRSRWSMFVSV